MNNIIYILDACSTPSILKVLYFIKMLINVIFIIIPAILILMLIIDVTKSIMAGDEEKIKKNTSLLIKRLLAYVFLFFVPTIINITINICSEIKIPYTVCWTNANKETIEKYEKENADTLTLLAEKNPTQKNISEAQTAINQITDNETKKAYEERINKVIKEQQAAAIEKMKEAERQARSKNNVIDGGNDSNGGNSNNENPEGSPNPQTTTLNGHGVTLEAGDDRVYFLDTIRSGAGQAIQCGDSILIESNGKYGLIDTGVEEFGELIANYLKDIGATNLEFILITHTHKDHIGGYDYLIKNGIKPKTLYIKDITQGYSKDLNKSRYTGTVSKSKEKNIEVKDVSKVSSDITLGDYKIKLYNVENKVTDASIINENMNSVVAVGTIHGKKIYFAADIGGGGDYNGTALEKEIANKIGQVDLYKASHHGNNVNNPLEAVKKLNPEYTVVTNTRDRNITLEAIKRITQNTRTTSDRIYYTGEGTVILTIASSGEFKFQQLPADN